MPEQARLSETLIPEYDSPVGDGDLAEAEPADPADA
jgi:hypothetical protein